MQQPRAFLSTHTSHTRVHNKPDFANTTEISEERGESLEEQNNILKNEIKEMKVKLAKQDLEKENNNLKKN